MSDTVTFEDVVQYPTLRRNEDHAQVTALQYLLRHRGHAIAADGIVGRRTWPAVVVTVRRGSTGDAVRAVQFQDWVRDGTGEMPKVFDGIFGPRTEASVRGFQQAMAASFPADHIAVDGIVGPVTWRGLVGGFLLL